jgi:flavodoxin
MKTLVIYVSIHHGNTEKVAKEMAAVLDAKLLRPWEVNVSSLSEYDLIGFGSGVYFQKHHKALLNLVDKLPKVERRKAFVFSTSGARKLLLFNDFDRPLREKLLGKGFGIVGEFSCRGVDTAWPFKLVGGISKGRPSKEDLAQARKFAQGLLGELADTRAIQKEVEK